MIEQCEVRYHQGVLTQAALGLCFALEVLPLSQCQTEMLLTLLSKISMLCEGSVGASVREQIEKTRAGLLDHSIDDRKVVSAILGLARTAELLGHDLDKEVRVGLHRLALEAKQVANEKGFSIGESTTNLVSEYLGRIDSKTTA